MLHFLEMSFGERHSFLAILFYAVVLVCAIRIPKIIGGLILFIFFRANEAAEETARPSTKGDDQRQSSIRETGETIGT